MANDCAIICPASEEKSKAAQPAFFVNAGFFIWKLGAYSTPTLNHMNY